MPWRIYKKVDPRRYVYREMYRLGRRGAFLALLGFIWIIVGIGTMVQTPSVTTDYYPLMGELLPKELLGGLWALTGLFGLWFAGKPEGHDAWGFGAIYVMPAFRAVAYLHGFIIWALPGGHTGGARGFLAALVWVAVMGAIYIVAGWRENRDEYPFAGRLPPSINDDGWQP